MSIDLGPLGQTDVSGIDTSFPRLSAQMYDMEIIKARVYHNDTSGKDSLEVKMKTTSDATSTTGERLSQGFECTTFIPLTPTEKMGLDKIVKNVALLGKAARLTASAQAIINSPEMLETKIVPFKVTVTKATEQYDEGNRFTPVVKE